MSCNIGISYFGPSSDGSTPGQRSKNTLRPSLAMATQERVLFHKFILLVQAGNEGKAGELENEIKEIWARRGGRRKSVPDFQLMPIAMEKPYDFNYLLSALNQTLAAIAEQSPAGAVLHLGCGTGSHAMQLAYFFLADRQVFTRELVLRQPAPEGGSGPFLNQAAVTWKSLLNPVSLKWSDYDVAKSLAENDDAKRAKIIRTNNRKYHDLSIEIFQTGANFSHPILLLGETGVGKTYLARKIHEEWARRQKKPNAPFVNENCAGLRGELAYATLFGHTKDAFTGAMVEKKGRLKEADGGTLFLDEIGDLDPRTQALLLTAIETGEFRMLGDQSGETTKSEFRLIAATNHNLEKAMRDGTFRADLYMRINDHEFALPPIRELPEDMELLLDLALEEWNVKHLEKNSGAKIRISEGARRLFIDIAGRYGWPGNRREFNRTVVRLAVRRTMEERLGSGEIAEDDVSAVFAAMSPVAIAEPARITEVKSEPGPWDLASAFIHDAMTRHPGLAAAGAVEARLLEWAFLQAGEKQKRTTRLMAEAGRILFGPEGNPSDKFRKACLTHQIDPREPPRPFS